jgi:VWFA-related protein
MHRPLFAALSLAVSLALLTPLPSPGQAPDRSGVPEDTFGETIDVRVVNLEVVVVDGEGRRVTGLGPADLRLKVDGKPVRIDYFTEVAEGQAMAKSTAAEGAPPAVSGVEPGSAVGTSYLVFFDNTASAVTADRNVVLQGLIDELSRLRPQDSMAVVSFDGVRPALLSSWSRSPAELRRALEEAMQGRGHGLTREADAANLGVEAGQIDIQPDEIPGLMGGGLANPGPGPLVGLVEKAPERACMVVHRFENNLQRVASALTATMRSLAGVPGRKVALIASGGWPQSAKEYLLGTTVTRWPSGCKILGPALWNPVHEVANQVGFTLYPVLISELGQAVRAEGRDYAQPVNPQVADSQVRETLDLLARRTGGTAYAGGARRDLLARVADDTRSFYWIGFTPTWKGDDSGHQVEVEVARPGLKVRTRQGFQDLSRRRETTYMVESALLFGKAPGSLPLEAEFGTMPPPKGRKDKGMARVPLKLVIPMDHVTMVQRGKQYEAELELRVALLDEAGNRNDIPVLPVKLFGPQPPQPGQHAIYETTVEVGRRRQEAVVALFDPPSGKLMETKVVLVP